MFQFNKGLTERLTPFTVVSFLQTPAQFSGDSLAALPANCFPNFCSFLWDGLRSLMAPSGRVFTAPRAQITGSRFGVKPQSGLPKLPGVLEESQIFGGLLVLS